VWVDDEDSGRSSYGRPLAIPLCALSQSGPVSTGLGGAQAGSTCGAGEYDLCPPTRAGGKGMYDPRDLRLRDGAGEVVVAADES